MVQSNIHTVRDITSQLHTQFKDYASIIVSLYNGSPIKSDTLYFYMNHKDTVNEYASDDADNVYFNILSAFVIKIIDEGKEKYVARFIVKSIHLDDGFSIPDFDKIHSIKDIAEFMINKCNYSIQRASLYDSNNPDYGAIADVYYYNAQQYCDNKDMDDNIGEFTIDAIDICKELNIMKFYVRRMK